jgi:DNA-directed RNA polymerase specialized sigma24 family protein
VVGRRSVQSGVGLPPFQEFLDTYREDVFRFLVALIGREEADDCFQETFLSALRAYPRLRADSDLRAWVMTIAHRKAMDAHRSRARRPMPVRALPDAPVEPGPPPEPALWEAVRTLPSGQRSAVTLRFVADLPFREIGRALRCTEAAARQRVREGLTKLREVWTGE